MTWQLIHLLDDTVSTGHRITYNRELVAQWSDDIVAQAARKIKNGIPTDAYNDMLDKEVAFNIIKEFLPEPIRDAIIRMGLCK